MRTNMGAHGNPRLETSIEISCRLLHRLGNWLCSLKVSGSYAVARAAIHRPDIHFHRCRLRGDLYWPFCCIPYFISLSLALVKFLRTSPSKTRLTSRVSTKNAKVSISGNNINMTVEGSGTRFCSADTRTASSSPENVPEDASIPKKYHSPIATGSSKAPRGTNSTLVTPLAPKQAFRPGTSS